MLYDAYGRPVATQPLTREVAQPTLTGVRTVWHDTVASGLTPQRLAGLLRDAAEGDADAYLTLAEEMEERDLHYACELAKRKLAVSRLPVTVEAVSDSARDIELADAVRALVARPGFKGMIKSCLDGIGKGYSVVEIVWNRSGARWAPERYEWRDPHFFQFDLVARREIRLRDEADVLNGVELLPYKFIRHVPLIKCGIPIRGGLARLAAWAHMCKGYTVKDWLAFAEVFGMPIRMGKYGPSSTQEERDILRAAVANLGSDAAAILPESMQIEFEEASKSSGSSDFYKLLAEYLDDQVSKGVLGQTASSSGAPGKLGEEKLQAEVRDDIRDDDAEQVEETINRDLVKPFIDLNFGVQENYPVVQVRAVKNEDIKTLTEALAKLVPLGLKVEQSVVRDKLGLPDPDEKAKPEDLLGQISPSPPVTKGGEQQPRALNRATALNQETPPLDKGGELGQAAIDTFLTSFSDADLQREIKTVLIPVLNHIQETGDFGEAMEKLSDAYPEMDTANLQEMLTQMIFVAEIKGRLDAGTP
jgi:phage gp29-like protein